MMSERFSISPGRASPLGVTIRDDGINIAVVSRHADHIALCLFDDEGDREIARLVLLGRAGTDIHHGFVPGARAGMRYGLRADGPFDPSRGHRFDPAKLLVDPYAVRLDRPFAHHLALTAPRSAAIDTARLVPKAIISPREPSAALLPPKAPGVIYEIAVKAFTKRHPEVPEALRGTLAGLAHPRVIDHLARLGVDTVELMPIAAWIDERHLPALKLSNGWGYNPMTFLAPDPRLAPGGMAEIRRTVKALQDAGIRVLLDVVLNHTGESDAEGVTLSLRGLDNALYYRHANDDPGKLVNDTGCGNTLALDAAPVLRLAMDALRHWVDQTGIDGFRFDLATVLGRTRQGFSPDAPLLAAIDQDPLLSRLTIVAEPWDVGADGYRLGQFPPMWHEWNDRYRDDVRRFWRGDAGMAGALATRLAGSSDVFAAKRQPSRSINYVASHDGFTLSDVVSYSTKHNEVNGEYNRDGRSDEPCWNNGAEGPAADAATTERRGRDVRALLATLMVSLGTPMLTAGDELGRTQRGNNNAYSQDNDITWLDWANADETLIEFMGQLTRLRRSHRALTEDRFLTGAPPDIPDALWLHADGQAMRPEDWAAASLLGLVLYAPPEGAVPGDRVCIWFNRAPAEAAVISPSSFPGFAWRIACDSSRGRADLAEEINGDRLIVPGRSVVVLVAVSEARSAKSHGPDDALIGRLATAAGIQADWWELDGTHHQVSIEAKRALLRAMRLPLETAAEAFEALVVLQRERETPLPIALSATGAPTTAFLDERIAGDAKLYGLMAHLYSLRHRGDSGIGDFETLARFCETTARLGGAVAGINPLHHLFPTDRERASPYQPSDRRFIDPIYIDMAGLDASMPSPRLRALLGGSEGTMRRLGERTYVNYTGIWNLKRAALPAAFSDFGEAPATAPLRQAFEAHKRLGGDALRRHAIFESLAEKAGSADSSRWPTDWRQPDSRAVADFAAANPGAVEFRMWLQWIAERQFAAAAERARSAGLALGIYRDLALGTAMDGGEIWADPELFAAGVSLGAPPDPFSRDGQVWQLAPFDPHALRLRGYEPLRAMLAANLRHAGVLRIDHILGFMRQFWVPAGAPGKDGAYVDFPLDTLIAIAAIESRRARCTIVGEDLGTVPDGLRQKLAGADILAYRVLWFEKDGDEFRMPERYPRLSVSCLSSHDLPTFMAWRRGRDIELDREMGRLKPEEVEGRRAERQREEQALRTAIERAGISAGQGDRGLMAAAHEFMAQAPSAVALIQADDLWEETEPLNLPGTDRERPNWRRRQSGSIEDLPDREAARQVVAAVRRGRSNAR